MKKFSTEYQPTNRRKPDKLTELLKQRLNEPATLNPNITHASMIIETLLEMAKNGNIRAIQLIFERLEGKPLQALSIEQTDLKLPDIIILPPNQSKPPVYREEDITDPLETN